MQTKQMLKNGLWVLLGATLFGLLLPAWNHWVVGETVQPRPVAARGDFTAQEQSTIQIFEHTSPSVVFITTTQKVVDMWTRNVRERPSGTGTGFVWDKNGHIVTNYHVIEGYRTAKVRLSDQRMFEADVVGASPEHDLAVLKLRDTADMPPPVLIGSSSDLRVGQSVLAIGNPFGLDHTLTTGIVSALGRSLDDSANTVGDLIQTDAAINPGNSGGPLLDNAGRVIGVNVAIYSPSGGSAGIGFAIPVDTVNRVVPQLVEHGHYIRPILGITLNDDVSQRINKRLDVQGILVLQVSPDSPAAKAGIRGTEVSANDDLILGDIIQSIDGKPINTSNELTQLLDSYQLNDTVKVKFLRAGKQVMEVEMRLTLQR